MIWSITPHTMKPLEASLNSRVVRKLLSRWPRQGAERVSAQREHGSSPPRPIPCRMPLLHPSIPELLPLWCFLKFGESFWWIIKPEKGSNLWARQMWVARDRTGGCCLKWGQTHETKPFAYVVWANCGKVCVRTELNCRKPSSCQNCLVSGGENVCLPNKIVVTIKQNGMFQTALWSTFHIWLICNEHQLVYDC